MPDQHQLAAQFEAERGRLQAIASRMLGPSGEADDVVQEAWLRLNRSDTDEIGNLPGWLTRVTSRLCLDHLRSRTSRRETSLDYPGADQVPAFDDPEADAVLADSVGTALMLVLDRLTPAERVAFVLHDSFAIPFEEIAPILDRTPAATRKLASRARRKVQADSHDSLPPGSGDLVVIDAFLAAARTGDMAALLHVLAPGVTVHADATAVTFGVDAITEGNDRVAGFFKGRAAAAFPARIDGGYGAIWMARGAPRVAFHFTIDGDIITRIDLVANPERLDAMKYELIHRPR
jgi:RNA polymerase sigma-70 factor (ECF subfamily)